MCRYTSNNLVDTFLRPYDYLYTNYILLYHEFDIQELRAENILGDLFGPRRPRTRGNAIQNISKNTQSFLSHFCVIFNNIKRKGRLVRASILSIGNLLN